MEGISDVSFAERAIRTACEKLGLQTNIKVVSVTNRWRWMLDFEQDPLKPDIGMNMIKIETLVQEALKRPIDLRLEPLADRNLRQKRNVLTNEPK